MNTCVDSLKDLYPYTILRTEHARRVHPLADLPLFIDVHPSFAIVGRAIAETSWWLLLVEKPLDSVPEPRIFGKAQFAQGRDILQDISHVAGGETQLEPGLAGLRITPASRVGGGGRVATKQEGHSLFDGALDVCCAPLGRDTGQGQQGFDRSPSAGQLLVR